MFTSQFARTTYSAKEDVILYVSFLFTQLDILIL